MDDNPKSKIPIHLQTNLTVSQIRGNFSTQILKKWLSVGWNEKIHKKEISRVSEQSSWDFRLKEGKISSSRIV